MDDYELVPKDDIQALREEIRRFKNFSAPETGGQMQPPLSADAARMVNLYNSVEKLNASVTALLQLFQRAQLELIKEKGSQGPERFSKLESQNEKIASGIISVVNMIRDQQLQLNQLNSLYADLKRKLDENAPKRRDFAFRIPPGYAGQQGQASLPTMLDQELFPAPSALRQPLPQPALPTPNLGAQASPPEPKKEEGFKLPVLDILSLKKEPSQAEDIPIPEPPKTSFLDRFKKR